MMHLFAVLACSTPPAATTTTETPSIPTEPAAVAPPPLTEGQQAWLSQRASEAEAARVAAFKSFGRVETDEIEQRRTYAPKNAPKYVNSKTAVYGTVTTKLDNTPTVAAVRFNYAGNEWIFFDRITIASGEYRFERRFENPPARNHAGGRVGELVLASVNPKYEEVPVRTAWETPELFEIRLRSALQMVEALNLLAFDVAAHLADPGKVTVRFSGDSGQHDHVMQPWEKASILALLDIMRPQPTEEDARTAVPSATSGPPTAAQ